MKSFFIRALLQIELEGCCTVPVCNAKARAIAQHLLADPWNSFVLLKAQQVDWIHFLIGYLTFRSTFFFFSISVLWFSFQKHKGCHMQQLAVLPISYNLIKNKQKKKQKQPKKPQFLPRRMTQLDVRFFHENGYNKICPSTVFPCFIISMTAFSLLTTAQLQHAHCPITVGNTNIYPKSDGMHAVLGNWMQDVQLSLNYSLGRRTKWNSLRRSQKPHVPHLHIFTGDLKHLCSHQQKHVGDSYLMLSSSSLNSSKATSHL